MEDGLSFIQKQPKFNEAEIKERSLELLEELGFKGGVDFREMDDDTRWKLKAALMYFNWNILYRLSLSDNSAEDRKTLELDVAAINLLSAGLFHGREPSK